jgi:hypothetical protein
MLPVDGLIGKLFGQELAPVNSRCSKSLELLPNVWLHAGRAIPVNGFDEVWAVYFSTSVNVARRARISISKRPC